MSTSRRVAEAMALLLFALVVSFPLTWAILCSLRPEEQLFGAGALGLGELVLDNYRALFESRRFWLPIKNSLIVAGSTTVACVVIGTLAAYALARLRFAGKRGFIAGVLAISMFPQIAIVSPLYLVLRELGWIDSYPGLVVPYVTFALPLSIWLLLGYLKQLPPSLEEAAFVDGASRLRTLWEVVVPLALPGIATTAIVTFVFCWNEFLFALSFTVGPERQTVPVAVALFRGRYQIPWGQVLAAAVIATLPVALAVLAFQRRIAQSFGGR